MKGFVRDVLLKMKWSTADFDSTRIIFVSRGSPNNTGSISGEEVEHLGRSFIITFDGTHIPYHRVKEIWNNDEIIWIRDQVRS
jgi:uncharacterized protein (UPF0248 family)